MKKTFTKLLLTGLLCTLVWQINSVEQAQAVVVNSEYMQEIPLNATHFPDETFRQYVSHALDINKDGVYQNIFKVKKSLAFSSIPCYTVGKASGFYSKRSVKFNVSINSYHSCF